jgi:glycosyltransferase involved in cell wall biosynthesis
VKVYPLQNIQGEDLTRKLRYPFWLGKNLFHFYNLLRKADAVHVPIPSDMGTIPMIMAHWMKKPLFVRHCGNWLVQKTTAERFWRRFMEKNAGGQNVMLTTGGASEPPSFVNPNIQWIFSSSLRMSEIDALRVNPSQLDPENPRLIIVCRQDKEKGSEKVIAALPELMQRFPNIHLDVVGNGGYLPVLKKQVTELGLSEKVSFHGKVNHERVLTLMQKAHFFCYPTQASEGFPKVVLESMASGLPVITNPVSVLPELMKDEAGIILKNDDAKSISKALSEIINNPELYRNIQLNAQKRARQYSLEAWRDTIGDHLRTSWKRDLMS